MLTHGPNQAQSVLSLVSPANTVHETSNWKCDKASASAASSFPMIASEMIYAYVVAGNTAPYCVPLPATAGASLTSSVWMHIGYALKKYEQSLWAAYLECSLHGYEHIFGR